MNTDTRFVLAISALALMLTACSPSPAANPAEVPCPEAVVADVSGISQTRADALVGMTEIDSQQCAESIGWGWRIGERDGEPFAVTKDYRPDRVTVLVTADRVTNVEVG